MDNFQLAVKCIRFNKAVITIVLMGDKKLLREAY